VDGVKRGDVVVVAMQGDQGKPRPAVVIQSDAFNEKHATITLCPVTTTILDAPLFRPTVDPSPTNGLRKVSQIMVDKMVSIPRDKIGPAVGSLDDLSMVRVNRAATLWLGLAD
jgi:mRNA interferase MazF